MNNQTRQQQIRYLLARAGFGTTPAELDEASRKSLRKVVRQLFKGSASMTELRVVDADTNEPKRS